MILQCLGKLYSGTIYSEKQGNIYEHIYRLYSPNSLQTPPPVQKHSGPEKISRKHIYTEDKNILVPLNLQFREHMYNSNILLPLDPQLSNTIYTHIKNKER